MPPRRRRAPRALPQGGADGQAQGPAGPDGQGGPPPPTYDTSQVVYPVMVESQSTPIQADGAIWVDAARPLVARTAFLKWKVVPSFRGNTASDAVLTSAQAVAAFLPRCFVEDTPQAKAAADNAHPLNFRLSATAWSRIISVYVDSGLLDNPCADLPSFRKVMAELTIVRPQDLAITQGDWNLGEAFTIPAGNANDEVEAREILSPLRFLSLASVTRLENHRQSSTRFGVLSTLIGALGPCLTDAIRKDETASVHFVAHRLRQSAGSSMRDGAIAFHLPEVISMSSLPEALQPHSAEPNDLMNEFIDALLYTGSVSSREAVEEKRVFCLGRRMPTVKAFILDRCQDKASAFSFLKLLRSSLLPKESASLESSAAVDLLEAACSARRALLHEAASLPGATAASIVETLLTERAALLSASGGVERENQAQGEGTLQQAYPLSNQALETALSQSSAFRAIQRELAIIDTSTEAGSRRALTHAFNGECVLAVRILCNTTPIGDVHAKRLKTLAQLNDLRPQRIDYFNHAMRLDTNSGTIPARMLRYSFATVLDDSLLNNFLQFKFEKMDWIKAPSGVQGYRQLVYGWENPSTIHPLDYYCQPDLLRELGEFGVRLFSALGCTVDSPEQGYDFRQLCEFFAQHLNYAKRLASLDKQYDWLQSSTEHFVAALALIGSTMRQRVMSSDPANVRLTRKLITNAAEPIAACLRQQQNLERVTDFSTSMEFFQPNTVRTATEHLPLLSQRYANPSKKQAATAKAMPSPKRPKAVAGPSAGHGYEPGSLTHTYSFQNNGNTLSISGKEWDLVKLSRYLRVAKHACCWPFLLAECQPHNRAARCNRWGQPGHRSDSDSAHRLNDHPNGLNLNDLASRFAVIADRRKLAQPAPQGKKGKGGRGGRGGRGRGRVRALQGGDPAQFDVDDDEISILDTGEQGNELPTA